jgi:hypothetical protein
MLTDAQRNQLDYLCEQEDDVEVRKKHIAQLDAEALAYLIDKYNWDDGFEVPTAIATHPACCRAVALRLFWAASGRSWFERVHKSEPKQAWMAEWYTFCELVSDGILSGRYVVGTLSFDPELDRIELYKIRKAGILPEALYLSIRGSTASAYAKGAEHL